MSHTNFDVAEDDLSGLTAEELKELSEFIDPDNELLPASDRLPPQTKKRSSGPYDRKHLLEHLTKQAAESKVGEDYVPFVKKAPKESKSKATVATYKRHVPTEFDDMLDMLDEDDLTELASELGLHGMVNQAQSRGDEPMVANPSTGLHKPGSLYSYQPTSLTGQDEPVKQDTDIEEAISSLRADDPYLTELNLNNHGTIDADVIDEIIDAMVGNTQLVTLQMTNVRFTEDHAEALATKVLRKNATLRVLNLESNRVTPKGIKFIMRGLAENRSTALRELRLANQYFPGGARAESDIAKYLKDIMTIVKLGYSFANASYRTKVDQYIMRNTDQTRRKRASLNM